MYAQKGNGPLVVHGSKVHFSFLNIDPVTGQIEESKSDHVDEIIVDKKVGWQKDMIGYGQGAQLLVSKNTAGDGQNSNAINVFIHKVFEDAAAVAVQEPSSYEQEPASYYSEATS